ncbi:hypothetical protein AK830_g1682 [Neonectria ditissima]|uniref:Uncharacterized protein n=1 Tax=Neonectria ditissima TaxID=78410 RepID=A0A0P7BYC6_9HYPO|nr:hypothetical protein AK830_g1682 [Neonectria ditissima]
MATPASPSPSLSPVRDPDNGSGAQRPKQPSALYTMVMTPVNLVVFLVSLAIVDLRYTIARANNSYYDASVPRWLPPWLTERLRRLVMLFRARPYRHLGASAQDPSGDWHYHSKQKKLIKMEAAEAFQLHGTVLAALGVIAVGLTVIIYYVSSRVYHTFLGSSNVALS